VEKEHLNGLIHHIAGSSPEDAKALLALREQYPFSQVLQVLAARAGKDHNLDNHQTLLQTAAVYSTDRSVLKNIMTLSDRAPVSSPVIDKPEHAPVRYEHDTEIADETLLDLEKLNKLKHNFEVVVEEYESGLAKEKKPKPKRAPGRPRKKKSDQDPLIEEIKSTKKKVDPANEKTKEQIQIIDQFIKTKPTISGKVKPEAAEAGDLSSKSNDFTDNIVSETLVEILVRQGKKEKAMEVLRKLIWKFPQKKAYFAAQIEELKK
jgi:hypothetical protein